VTQAMIGAPPKRSLTTAQRRLRKADPTIATRMDEWALELDATLGRFQTMLDREYDLAVNDDIDEGVPPGAAIIDVEAELAVELGRFDLAMNPMCKVADGVRQARDEAYMVLGRVEQLIAQRTLDALSLTPQAALPPPPPPDDDDDDDPGDTEPLRVIRKQATIQPWRQEGFDDATDTPTVPLATKTGRWWTRVRGWGRQLRAATTLLLAGVA
jgi:hypothetical protein